MLCDCLCILVACDVKPQMVLVVFEISDSSISPKNPIKREKKKLVFSSEREDTMLL